MRGEVLRMLVGIVGASLMLAGGAVLLSRPTIPIGPDGFAFVGVSDGAAVFPATPVATALLAAGFVVVVASAVAGAVVARRRGPGA